MLEALDGLKDWPEKVRLMQANWIGKSRGLQFAFHTVGAPEGFGKLEVYTTRPDTLMGALRMRGRVLPGPHGIGIASEEPGRVIDARGQPDPTLLVLGAMRIGTLWESLAIPELRGQAQALAECLRAMLEEPVDSPA